MGGCTWLACFITPLILGLLVLVASRLSESIRREGVDSLGVMLTGGALLLAAEHAWHGEIPGALAPTLHDTVITGSLMTLAVTAAWAGGRLASRRLEIAARLRALARAL